MVANRAGSSVRVGAEVWLKEPFKNLGPSWAILLGALVIAIGIVIVYAERDKKLPIKPAFFGLIVAESAVYAVVVALIVSRLVGALLNPAMMALTPQSSGAVYKHRAVNWCRTLRRTALPRVACRRTLLVVSTRCRKGGCCVRPGSRTGCASIQLGALHRPTWGRIYSGFVSVPFSVRAGAKRDLPVPRIWRGCVDARVVRRFRRHTSVRLVTASVRNSSARFPMASST